MANDQMAFLFNDLAALYDLVLQEYELTLGTWKGSHQRWWESVRMPFINRSGMLAEDIRQQDARDARHTADDSFELRSTSS